MGKGGYYPGTQPDDLPVETGGIGTSGEQEKNKSIRDNGGSGMAPVVEHPANTGPESTGDAPSFKMPPFANGKDLRNYSK